MNNKPFKVFPDAIQTVDLLSDVEAGRLFKALIHYVNGLDDVPTGKELLVYTMMRAQIDRDAASSEEYHRQRQEAGKKGGRPKKTDFQNVEKAQKGDLFQKKVGNLDIDNDIDYDLNVDNDNDYNNDYTQKAAAADLPAPDSPAAYASSNLQYMSPHAFEELATFQQDLPDDVILHGIDAACNQGKRTWAYTRSILNRYVSDGYKSIGDVIAAEDKHKRQGGTTDRNHMPEYKDFDLSEGL